MFPFYSTRLARQKFYLEKNFSSESSRVKFKNGIHSTRSSFHCFVSSEFRVLVEYFWRSIVIFMHLQKNVLPYCVLHKCCAWIWHQPPGDPSKKLNPEHLEYDYERLNWQNIQRTSLPNDKSKTAKGSPSIKTLFQKGPGKTKASHQSKAEMEANKKKKAKKENIWTAHANSDVSDSQLNDSDETQIV